MLDITLKAIQDLPRSQRNRALKQLRKKRTGYSSAGEVQMSDRLYYVARDGSFRRANPKPYRTKKDRQRAKSARIPKTTKQFRRATTKANAHGYPSEP